MPPKNPRDLPLKKRFHIPRLRPVARNMLKMKEARDIMKTTNAAAPAAKLFGDMWQEGELAILFADTGKGKSVLAVQIGVGIASSVPLEPLACTWPPRNVLYVDFEMSAAQFVARYSEDSPDGKAIHYEFPGGFYRTEIDPESDYEPDFDSFEDFLFHSICCRLDEARAKVLIIDNITFLNTSDLNTSAAIRVMKGLKLLKQLEGLSILVLAHTPKRHFGRPLSVNDLQGSKMLSNFADNIFAIGHSTQANDLRYVKHIKARSTELRHDASNVILYRLGKLPTGPQASLLASSMDNGQCTTENVRISESSENCPLSTVNCPFLGFTHVGYAQERDHLIRPYDNDNADRQLIIAQAKALQSAGRSQREIAAALGIGLTTAHRYLSEPPA